jgi:hypothetical protein
MAIHSTSKHSDPLAPDWKLLVAMLIILLALLPACRQSIDSETPGTEVMEDTASSVPPTAAVVEIEPAPAILAPTRVGANYVLQLPRDNALPVGWAMDRRPDYRDLERQSGETYRFTCLDLPARSIGVASVGYRSLEGLPNVYIEYVVYRNAADAGAAMADMLRATAACGEFTIGQGNTATTAQLVPIDFRSYGQESFAGSLETTNGLTGALVTHFLKIRQDNVVIGINHATQAANAPPEIALTQSLAALSLRNLSGAGEEY